MKAGTNAITHFGLVAGRGHYPLMFCREAKRHGVRHLAVVAMHGETEPEINELADRTDWVYVGQLDKTIKTFRRQQVTDVVSAGQVSPRRLFDGLRPDVRTLKILAVLKERNAESIFTSVADEFGKNGINVLPATTFLERFLAPEGLIGKVKPGKSEYQDVAFGQRIAAEISRLDIGQTVVVKGGTVLAVEAFEGTDKAICRGGELGRGGIVVVKAAKPGHDIRFDVPCIGLRTVEKLRAAGAKTLAVQAGVTLFIEMDRVIDELNHANIAVVGYRPEA